MIIVSQDKETILNFNNAKTLVVVKEDEYSSKYVINEVFETDDYLTLGIYETRERAREVLEEIINIYKATESFIAAANRFSNDVGALAIQKGFVYYMPI